MADKTAGQYIAERYFLDDNEVAIALAKDIDSAIANAINLENESCAKIADDELGASEYEADCLDEITRERATATKITLNIRLRNGRK